MSYKILFKKLGRSLLLGLGGLGVVAGLLTIAAHTPRQWNLTLNRGSDCNFTIYVSGDSFHTNIIVPVTTSEFDWRDQLPLASLRQTPSPQYLQFGWGDRIFYAETPSWERVNLLSAARSLFYWDNASAAYVAAHATLPRPAHEEIKCVRLNQADYRALTQFLQASLQRNAQGQLLPIRLNSDGQSGFFAATGRYSILKTCNSWTADGLRAANVNTPIWGGLASAVLGQVKNGCECGG